MALGQDEGTKSYVGNKKTAEQFRSAAHAGDVGRLEELLAADPGLVWATDSDGDTAVHAAAYYGHTEVVSRLLAADPGLAQATDHKGWKAVHEAAKRGHTDLVQLLLDTAPELLHAENKEGQQPMHLAVWGGDAGVLGVLIESGAHVDAQDKYGRTPLHWAAVSYSEACVRALLAAGACVDVEEEDGKTPLHLAAGCNSEACACALLASNAPIDAKDKCGRTARDVAEEESYREIVALLEEHEKSTRSHKPAETVPKGKSTRGQQTKSAKKPCFFSGQGRGSSLKTTFCGDGMLSVWLVVLAMVLGIFALVAITGRGMVTIDDPDQLGGGPWWAWMLGVILLLSVFVIVYMISIQYAEPVLMYKISRDEEEGLPLKKTGGANA